MRNIFALSIALSLGFVSFVAGGNDEKLRKFKNLYPSADANNDNILTVGELSSFLQSQIPSSANSKKNDVWGKRLKRFLDEEPRADRNGDGALTKVELIKFLRN